MSKWKPGKELTTEQVLWQEAYKLMWHGVGKTKSIKAFKERMRYKAMNIIPTAKIPTRV